MIWLLFAHFIADILQSPWHQHLWCVRAINIELGGSSVECECRCGAIKSQWSQGFPIRAYWGDLTSCIRMDRK